MTRLRARANQARDAFAELIQVETDDCVLWPFGLTADLYGNICIDGRNHNVHRLALQTRVGPPPDCNMHAAHSCCNKNCLNYRHLRWATATENAADRHRDGTAGTGERNSRAKLSAADVVAIRASSESAQLLAERYGLGLRAIKSARNGRTYVDVAAPFNTERQVGGGRDHRRYAASRDHD